jgi:hypothetical protein
MNKVKIVKKTQMLKIQVRKIQVVLIKVNIMIYMKIITRIKGYFNLSRTKKILNSIIEFFIKIIKHNLIKMI